MEDKILGKLYFAYGSNMFTCRLEERVGKVKIFGTGRLMDYRLVFNKLSKDSSGKASVIESPGSFVFGIIFDLSKDQFKNLDKYEGNGYERKMTSILFNERLIMTSTYFVKSEFVKNNLKPTNDYLDLIICGAKDHKLNAEYIKFLHSFKTHKY